jgi:hypothetical protein
MMAPSDAGLLRVSRWQELDLMTMVDEASFEGLMSSLARSHGCPNLHTL